MTVYDSIHELALLVFNFVFPIATFTCALLQNGHVGFMLSCYDADISYDPRTDTFQAR